MSASSTAVARPLANALDGPHPSRVRRWSVPLASTLVLAVSGAVATEHLADAREGVLRERRVEVQRLERRARRLGGDGIDAVLLALEEDRDALRLRLVEALEAARADGSAEALRYRVEEHGMPPATDAATLRVVLSGSVVHGAMLLSVLDAVHAASRPWPTETRGCLLQRLEAVTAARSGLTVDCLVDVLHWSDLDAPGG